MTPDELPLETSAGQRPPNAGADRIMVGLAVLVLLGAVLILVGKVLPKSQAVAEATPSSAGSVKPTARPTSTPWPTPTPRPLGEVILLEGTPPSQTPQPTAPFNGWIRARTKLIIHFDPALDSPSYSTLSAGSLAAAWSDPVTDANGDGLGWLNITAPHVDGWVATTVNGVSLVDRIVQPPVPYNGYLFTLASGQNGYVALGSPASRSDQPGGTLQLVSTDGASWRWGRAPNPNWIAWGPAGWLTYTVDNQDTRQAWVWRSSDGLTWEPLGAWVDPNAGNVPYQLVASPSGYMFVTQPERGIGGNVNWFSSDGVTWDEMPETGLSRDIWPQVIGTDIGFYIWDTNPADKSSTTSPMAAFSADGRHWAPVYDGPTRDGVQIGSVDGGLLATSIDPVSGSAQVWTGSLTRSGIAWRRDPGQDQAFAGAAVTATASDGQRLAFFGWSRATEQAIVWIRNGKTWVRSLLPASFGGLPHLAAVGPHGFVVVGYRTNERGASPVFWRQSAHGWWVPETHPIIGFAPNAAPAECGKLPQNGLDWTLLDRVSAVSCFGHTPMTIRMFSASCDGCYSGPSGRRTPEWLAEPGTNQLQVSPVENSNGGQLVLAPNLGFDPSWWGHWVEVTGHFDDPAAATCTWLPGPDELSWYSGRQDVVNGCRQTFVVTAIRLVDGP